MIKLLKYFHSHLMLSMLTIVAGLGFSSVQATESSNVSQVQEERSVLFVGQNESKCDEAIQSLFKDRGEESSVGTTKPCYSVSGKLFFPKYMDIALFFAEHSSNLETIQKEMAEIVLVMDAEDILSYKLDQNPIFFTKQEKVLESAPLFGGYVITNADSILSTHDSVEQCVNALKFRFNQGNSDSWFLFIDKTNGWEYLYTPKNSGSWSSPPASMPAGEKLSNMDFMGEPTYSCSSILIACFGIASVFYAVYVLGYSWFDFSQKKGFKILQDSEHNAITERQLLVIIGLVLFYVAFGPYYGLTATCCFFLLRNNVVA